MIIYSYISKKYKPVRLKLTLLSSNRETVVPYNYQYALAAVIFKKIADADQAYADFLHQKGYGQNDYSRHFKFFTFSNLQGKFVNSKNALKLQGNQSEFVLACHMPDFAESLIKGVFADQRISIGDRSAQADFTVSQIEVLPAVFSKEDEQTVHTVTLKLISPMVVGRKNDRGNDDYLSPEDEDFISLLKQNLAEKLAVAFDPEIASQETIHKPFTLKACRLEKLKSRLTTIKAGKDAETKVRGFLGFELEMEASGKVINMALDAGLGGMNAMGFGCVEARQLP